MTKEDWIKIENRFKEWDEAGKFNASQRDILNFFKDIFEDAQKEAWNEAIEKAAEEAADINEGITDGAGISMSSYTKNSILKLKK